MQPAANTIELTEEDLALLHSKIGLRTLFRSKRINLEKVLTEVRYEQRLNKLQIELIKLQAWAINERQKVVIVFEGRDAAGKGGAIRRFTQHINPRHFKIVALDKPTPDERDQWFFQRYINHLPKPGEIVFFDRSWYNRAVVEPVNGFCSKEEYSVFMSQVNDFEKMIVASNLYLVKLYFSITKEEQAKRFGDIQKSTLKRWKMSPIDYKAQELWDDYTAFKERMFNHTHTEMNPWVIIDANKKSAARLEAIQHVLSVIPYK